MHSSSIGRGFIKGHQAYTFCAEIPSAIIAGDPFMYAAASKLSCHETWKLLQLLQEMVYYGALRDNEEDILSFLLGHFNALPRFNPRIMEGEGDDAATQLMLTKDLAPLPIDQLNYLHHLGTEDSVKAVTHWIIADLKLKVGPTHSCWSDWDTLSLWRRRDRTWESSLKSCSSMVAWLKMLNSYGKLRRILCNLENIVGHLIVHTG